MISQTKGLYKAQDRKWTRDKIQNASMDIAAPGMLKKITPWRQQATSKVILIINVDF